MVRRHTGCWRVALAVSALVGGARLSAQELPIRRLDGRLRAGAEFSEVTAVRELSDGRVLVSDVREKRLTLLAPSLAGGTAVGRIGEGPGEYASPRGLYPLRGDTTLLHDDLGQRFLTILPDGRIRTDRTVQRTDVSDPMTRVLFTDPEQARVTPGGRLCVQLTLSRTSTADSTDLRCGPYEGGPSVSVARLRVPERRPLDVGRGGPPIPTNVRFAPGDGWALDEGGSLGIVRSAPYRVEWRPRGGGAPIVGPAIPVTAIPVTVAERNAVVAAWRERAPKGASPMAVRGVGGDTIDPNALMARATPPIATHKAAFDPAGVVAAPGQELWVPRYGAADAPPRYDVFNAQGHLVRRVEIATRSRVIAVTRRHVYTVLIDEDGLHHLERWNRPS